MQRSSLLKQALIDAIDWVYEQELRFVSGLPEAERTAAGSFEHWSAKDTIAHNAEWKVKITLFLEKLESKGVEKKDELPSESTDAVNRRIYDKYHDRSWEEILAHAKDAYEGIRSKVGSISSVILDDPEKKRLEWSDKDTPVWHITVYSNAIGHPVHHLAQYYRKHARAELADRLEEGFAPVRAAFEGRV